MVSQDSHAGRAPYRVVVLISGSGSNLQAIIHQLHNDSREAARVVLVVSSKADALGLERAREAGIAASVVSGADYPDRETRDAALADVVAAAEPDLVVLAGYMSILTGAFLNRFPDRVINLHPSMLPAFPGMHAIADALAWGVRLTGVTVHFAEEEVDAGPPILQEAVPVEYGDTVDALARRVHAVEHRLLPEAVRLFAAGRVRRDAVERRVVEIKGNSR